MSVIEGLSQRNQRLVKLAAKAEVESWGIAKDALNLTPWGSPKLTERQKVAKYAAVRQDPQALAEIHDNYKLRYRVPPERRSQRFRKEMQQMERLFQRYVLTGALPQEEADDGLLG